MCALPPGSSSTGPTRPAFYYDYVDPASYLIDRWLRSLEADTTLQVRRRPFEIRRPPAPLIDPNDEDWDRYVSAIREVAQKSDIPFDPPGLIPWSRKAHELALHARDAGRFDPVHDRLFHAYFADGRDIGRVDVLVDLGTECGLDSTDLKVILDVDRFTAEVEEERAAAEAAGIRGVPTIRSGAGSLEGFRPRADVLTFLDPDA